MEGVNAQDGQTEGQTGWDTELEDWMNVGEKEESKEEARNKWKMGTKDSTGGLNRRVDGRKKERENTLKTE